MPSSFPSNPFRPHTVNVPFLFYRTYAPFATLVAFDTALIQILEGDDSASLKSLVPLAGSPLIEPHTGALEEVPFR